jgi:DNA-3-methyladenine glycosylase
MPKGKKLPVEYYHSLDVTAIAKDLLGKYVVSKVDGMLTSGMIVETEAYRGPDDRACHAYNNRRTDRTEVMFAAGGVAYIYICYGMHHLMNVVTAPEDHAHAVLIRAIQPEDGADIMAARRLMPPGDKRIGKGPGALSQALGLRSHMSGTSLHKHKTPIWIEDRGVRFTPDQVCVSERIGVESAGDAATWPWRFFVKGNPSVSAHRKCLKID